MGAGRLTVFLQGYKKINLRLTEYNVWRVKVDPNKQSFFSIVKVLPACCRKLRCANTLAYTLIFTCDSAIQRYLLSTFWLIFFPPVHLFCIFETILYIKICSIVKIYKDCTNILYMSIPNLLNHSVVAYLDGFQCCIIINYVLVNVLVHKSFLVFKCSLWFLKWWWVRVLFRWVGSVEGGGYYRDKPLRGVVCLLAVPVQGHMWARTYDPMSDVQIRNPRNRIFRYIHRWSGFWGWLVLILIAQDGRCISHHDKLLLWWGIGKMSPNHSRTISV